jgi:hypothetical protein
LRHQLFETYESLHAKNANISADVRDFFVDSFANTVFDATLGFERLRPLVLSLFGYSGKPKDAFFVRDRGSGTKGKMHALLEQGE